MAITKALILLISVWVVSGQRPSFAGTKPIGFPEIEKKDDPLGNRFGSGSELDLPIEAKGDRDLVERISKMPIDKQPFWYINWKAYEENRKNPQTYQPGSNVFNPDPVNTNQGMNTNTGLNTNQRFNTNQGFNTYPGNSNQGMLNKAPQSQFASPDASKGLTSKFGDTPNKDDSFDDSDEDGPMNYNTHQPYGLNMYTQQHHKGY